MSGQDQAYQVEAQTAQVEEEYRLEEKRENKAMDAKLLAPKFNVNPRLSAQTLSNQLTTRSAQLCQTSPPKPSRPRSSSSR
jgi:hypothetical protein